MTEIVTIYVKLLEEGTHVWRPVQAQHLREQRFLLVGKPEDDEIWEFAPGLRVICEQRELSGGICDVAVRLAT